MAQKTVLQMVRNRLPFLAEGEPNDTLIEDFKQDVYYYLQPWTKKTDDVVEEDSVYTGLIRILIAEQTAYNIVTRKVMIEMGGVNGEASTGGKRIKKAKADVVEAEFEYASAKDGGTMITDFGTLSSELQGNICKYALALGYRLPGCPSGPKPELPTFMVFVDETETVCNCGSCYDHD